MLKASVSGPGQSSPLWMTVVKHPITSPTNQDFTRKWTVPSDLLSRSRLSCQRVSSPERPKAELAVGSTCLEPRVLLSITTCSLPSEAGQLRGGLQVFLFRIHRQQAPSNAITGKTVPCCVERLPTQPAPPVLWATVAERAGASPRSILPGDRPNWIANGVRELLTA